MIYRQNLAFQDEVYVDQHEEQRDRQTSRKFQNQKGCSAASAFFGFLPEIPKFIGGHSLFHLSCINCAER